MPDKASLAAAQKFCAIDCALISSKKINKEYRHNGKDRSSRFGGDRRFARR